MALGRNAASEYARLQMDVAQPFNSRLAMDWAFTALKSMIAIDEEKQLMWFHNGEFFEAVQMFGEGFLCHASYLYYLAQEQSRCRT